MCVLCIAAVPDTVNGMEAINQLADDTRQAKFQTTGQLHEDEVVLLNIVNVRVAHPHTRAHKH